VNVKQRPVLDHLVAMTDDTGLIQHATHDIPNRATGYCTDDIARALIVAVNASRNSLTETVGTRLVTTYLAYLHDAQMHDGWFHNFMGYDRTWQDRRGTPDSFGRALWGLGYCMRFAPRDSWRGIARRLLLKALPHIERLDHLRSRAYAALGLVHAAEASPDDRAVLYTSIGSAVKPIVAGFEREAGPGWNWCEPALTYDNARLAEALLRGGRVLNDARLCEIGRQMLDFYTGVVIEDGMFAPVGNAGWYPRGGQKARFGQQPIEAAGMIDACLAARAVTGDVRFLEHAEVAFDWFFGANSALAQLVVNGGCCDGIDAGGVNPNMGAESTVAYLHSAMAIVKPATARLQIVR
jgi:GNAT superfamily N-acetyltransferase